MDAFACSYGPPNPSCLRSRPAQVPPNPRTGSRRSRTGVRLPTRGRCAARHRFQGRARRFSAGASGCSATRAPDPSGPASLPRSARPGSRATRRDAWLSRGTDSEHPRHCQATLASLIQSIDSTARDVSRSQRVTLTPPAGRQAADGWKSIREWVEAPRQMGGSRSAIGCQCFSRGVGVEPRTDVCWAAEGCQPIGSRVYPATWMGASAAAIGCRSVGCRASARQWVGGTSADDGSR